MYYFYKNNDFIYKKSISFDNDKIDKIRNGLINNCSVIIHREYDSDYAPTLDNSLVRNYNEAFVGYKEYFEENRRVIHYSYDLLIPPKLVNLIDRLLSGDVTALHEIHYNYYFGFEKTIDDMIESKNNELRKTQNKNATNTIKILNELRELMKCKELNKNQISTYDYYYQLLNCINEKTVSKLDKKTFDKVNNFFDNNVVIEKGKIINEDNNTKIYKKTK